MLSKIYNNEDTSMVQTGLVQQMMKRQPELEAALANRSKNARVIANAMEKTRVTSSLSNELSTRAKCFIE